jgi:2-oxoisovalerate dehydrogenase E2 component (dihydrolipoyl transacylase)
MGRFVFKLPDVGEGVAEAEIVAWRVAVGDRVEEDQPVVDVMTDKATVEIGAPVAGVVAQLHGEPGALRPVGSPLIEFDTEKGASQKPVAKSPSQAEPAKSEAAPVVAPPAEPASKPLAAPAVRKQAADLGVDLGAVTGTGPEGRITHEDLQALAPAAAVKLPTPGDDGVTEVKVIGLRRRIADKMREAKTRIPHFSYVEEVDVTELEALRAHLNAGRGDGRPKLTLLPFLIAALVRALPQFPQINARFDDDAGVVRRYRAVHVGIAVQTDAGLTVPVLRHAEGRDLWALAAEIARLADGARAGKLASDALSGSTITLTSLGPLGGIAHTPVVNWPEVAIVGPNRVEDRAVVRGGQIVVRRMMNLSSSFDHRVVDGFDAATFIQQMKGLLEHPGAIFAG